MKFLHELIDYLHGDKPYQVREYIIQTVAKTTDNNKGKFWEEVLSKAMKDHTSLLEHNAKGRDFSDNTDAKFATFYKKENGLGSYEASVSGISNKIGPLRVCLCYSGVDYHRLYYLFIPHEAYAPYIKSPNSALKFGMSPQGKPTGKLSKYLCSFEKVIQPYNNLTTM